MSWFFRIVGVVAYSITSFVVIWIETGIVKESAPATASSQVDHSLLTVY